MCKVDREKNFFAKKSSGAPLGPPRKKYPEIFGKIQKQKTLFDPLKVIQSIFFIKWTPPKPAKIWPNAQHQLDVTTFKVSFDHF